MMDSENKQEFMLNITEDVWNEAKLKYEVISPLIKEVTISHQDADDAAEKLGISRRHVYRLIEKLRQGNGNMSDFITTSLKGGKGKSRLRAEVDEIINQQINKYFLKKQKIRVSVLYQYITDACKKNGFKPPSRNAISIRISSFDQLKLARVREGSNAAHEITPVKFIDHSDKKPLDQIQMDHTVIDLVIVDEKERQPIGRSYITVAIDTYSRCILGAVVTLEPPCSVSVGLCLSQVVCDKQPWLESLGIDVNWKMGGKPVQIYVDNAAEFKSTALTRGCDLHGIKLDYRPIGQPHYGGIVERVIGTLMRKVHNLPGTTFSNAGQKGRYNSDKHAILTIKELEKWIVFSINEYHHKVHSSLKTTPSAKWHNYFESNETPKLLTNTNEFLIDFLPIIKRKLKRTGFVIDHIYYYSNSLKPYISQQVNSTKYTIRRDPRDISRIWVLDEDKNQYLEVPYRYIGNPPISTWEHKKAITDLKKKGISEVNESQIFKSIEEMQNIEKHAAKTTKKLRRQNERKQTVLKSSLSQEELDMPIIDENAQKLAKPFDHIEEW